MAFLKHSLIKTWQFSPVLSVTDNILTHLRDWFSSPPVSITFVKDISKIIAQHRFPNCSRTLLVNIILSYKFHRILVRIVHMRELTMQFSIKSKFPRGITLLQMIDQHWFSNISNFIAIIKQWYTSKAVFSLT